MMTMTTPATSNAYYYISPSTDPYYNIALEDYLYRQLRPLDTIYMLWVNRPSVFMGRYQWAEAELDLDSSRSMTSPSCAARRAEARSTTTSGISISRR